MRWSLNAMLAASSSFIVISSWVLKSSKVCCYTVYIGCVVNEDKAIATLGGIAAVSQVSYVYRTIHDALCLHCLWRFY